MERICKNCEHRYITGYDSEKKKNICDCDILFDHQEGGIEVKDNDFCSMFFKEKKAK